jgi:hypothetical protein
MAVPMPTAVAIPPVSTVAMRALSTVHPMGRVTIPPAESTTVARNRSVCPTVIPALIGETVTLATPGGGGAVTVTAACPVLPPSVAVIVMFPTATPVTTPVFETTAIAPEPLVQVNTWPPMTAPF